MTKKTALQESMRVNLRRRRADSLARQILNLVEPYVHEEASLSDLSYKLRELFAAEGVEVVTDYDRQQFGLPPRGPDGWTVEEMIALEQKRLEALTRPLAPVFVPSTSVATK